MDTSRGQIPEKLRILPTDSEDVKASKRKKDRPRPSLHNFPQFSSPHNPPTYPLTRPPTVGGPSAPPVRVRWGRRAWREGRGSGAVSCPVRTGRGGRFASVLYGSGGARVQFVREGGGAAGSGPESLGRGLRVLDPPARGV